MKLRMVKGSKLDFYRGGLIYFSFAATVFLFVGALVYSVLMLLGIFTVAVFLSPSDVGSVIGTFVSITVSLINFFWSNPFYVVVAFVPVYLIYSWWNREWWDGKYYHYGRPRWKYLAVFTVVGLAGSVYITLLEYGSWPGNFPGAFLVYSVGLAGMVYFSGYTFLDDSANHGLETEWRWVWEYLSRVTPVVSFYGVIFGFPSPLNLGFVKGVFAATPFVVSGAYLVLRYDDYKGLDSSSIEEDTSTDSGTPSPGDSDVSRGDDDEEGDSMDMALRRIDELLYSDSPRDWSRGVKSLHSIARDNPEKVKRFIPRLIELLYSNQGTIQSDSAEILWVIGDEYPEEVKPAVPNLAELLESKYVPVYKNALGALAEIASEYPDEVKPYEDKISALVEKPDKRVRRNAFKALSHISPHSIPDPSNKAERYYHSNYGADRQKHRNQPDTVLNESEDGDVTGSPETSDTDSRPTSTRSPTTSSRNSGRGRRGGEKRRRKTGKKSSDGDKSMKNNKYLEPPPSLTLDDVGGMTDLIDELKKNVINPLKRPEIYEEHGASVVNGILFHGPPGTGKTYLSKALAGELSYNFIEIHSSDILSKYIGESANLVEELFTVALQNQPCIILIDEIDAIASKRSGGPEQSQSQRQMVSELLRQLTEIQGEQVVVIGTTNILEEVDDAIKRRKRFDKIFEVPLPDAEAREEILKVHLRDSPSEHESIDWKKMRELTDGYAAGDLETIVNTAAIKAAEEAHEKGTDVVPITQSHLEKGVKETEPSTKDLSEAADYLSEPPDLTFDDVGGMDELKKELRDIIIEPLKYPEVYEEYGLETVNGVLFHGPPGTGKTYVSEALAGELEYHFIEVKPDDIVSKWAGEAPNKLSKVFDVAVQNQPALVLIDEIDAIASSRGGGGHKTQTDRQTVNQLLTELERINGEEVIVISTTNMYEELDSAVVRSGRMDKKIEFPPPGPEAREEILKVHLRKPPVSDDIDWDKIRKITEDYVSSDLKAIAESAARKALEDGGPDPQTPMPIKQKHLEEAVEETESSLKKWR